MIVITCCTAKKSDEISIPDCGRIVQPKDYIMDQRLLTDLDKTRKKISKESGANFGKKLTYAFDLYVNTGFAYKKLKHNHYQKIKSLLLSKELDWYFLSGGYGIIHALEPARKYQATFNRTISYKKSIPFTTNLWKKSLSRIIDKIISLEKPERFYTFGSQDYTRFVKQTKFWKSLEKDQYTCKMFESTGYAGVHWVSDMLNELAYCIENKDLASFDRKYPSFSKQ